MIHETVVLVDLRVIMEGSPKESGSLTNATRPGAHELMEGLVATHTRVILVSPLFGSVEWQIKVGSWLSLQRFPKYIGMESVSRFDLFVSDDVVRPEELPPISREVA